MGMKAMKAKRVAAAAPATKAMKAKRVAAAAPAMKAMKAKRVAAPAPAMKAMKAWVVGRYTRYTCGVYVRALFHSRPQASGAHWVSWGQAAHFRPRAWFGRVMPESTTGHKV